EPGALERALLGALAQDIGVGTWPNQQKDPAESAASLILRAIQARTAGASLEEAEILRALALRTDFGRVSQDFPTDEARRVDRVVVQEELADRLTGKRISVVGPPGA